MRERHNQPNFQRPMDEYTTKDLCAFARDILRRSGVASVVGSRLSIGWNIPEGSIHLVCHEFEKEYPQYQIEMNDSALIDGRQTHIIHPEAAFPILLDKNKEQIENPHPNESIIRIMWLLRSNPKGISEPLIDLGAEVLFQKIAARTAVGVAFPDNEPTIAKMATVHTLGKTEHEKELRKEAIETAQNQGVEIDGITYPYSRSSFYIKDELGRRVTNAVLQNPMHSLPPARNPANRDNK